MDENVLMFRVRGEWADWFNVVKRESTENKEIPNATGIQRGTCRDT